MTTYPLRLDQRFYDNLKTLFSRVTRLEQRTQGIDSGTNIQTITGVIDPAYVSGDPMVTLLGASATSGPYRHLTSYTPVASDPVLMIPNGQTFVVAGKLA